MTRIHQLQEGDKNQQNINSLELHPLKTKLSDLRFEMYFYDTLEGHPGEHLTKFKIGKCCNNFLL